MIKGSFFSESPKADVDAKGKEMGPLIFSSILSSVVEAQEACRKRKPSKKLEAI
jgi:hypothetical protein